VALWETWYDQYYAEDCGMSGKVWISSVLSNYDIGTKHGLRAKFYNHEWEPATLIIPVSPDNVHEAGRRYAQGFSLNRSELSEAAAVWDEKRFKKTKDIFTAGGFFVVRGKLAEVLSRFDLGNGGLIPFTIYQADLVTPYPGEFFLLNFGARKDTILPERSENVTDAGVHHKTGVQYWRINSWHEDGDVAVRPEVLDGPDLWFDGAVHSEIFLSDRLAQALIHIEMKDIFKLKECRVAGGAA
jgi:hypothetical protein